MSEKIIYIDGVGNVLFRHSNRAKYLNLSVKPFVGARVSVPIGMSYLRAEQYVSERKTWFNHHLTKMKEFEKQQTLLDEKSGNCTKHHQLKLRSGDGVNISVRISKGKINVVYPPVLNTNSEEIQAAIRRGIEQALQIEAKQYLPDKVKILAAQFRFIYNKLSIKNIKSRWGSCSRKNNINLSIHLIRLPEYLIDYVILHELAHLVHHNHSAKFWNLLESMTGGAKILDKELKRYRIII